MTESDRGASSPKLKEGQLADRGLKVYQKVSTPKVCRHFIPPRELCDARDWGGRIIVTSRKDFLSHGQSSIDIDTQFQESKEFHTPTIELHSFEFYKTLML